MPQQTGAIFELLWRRYNCLAEILGLILGISQMLKLAGTSTLRSCVVLTISVCGLLPHKSEGNTIWIWCELEQHQKAIEITELLNYFFILLILLLKSQTNG